MAAAAVLAQPSYYPAANERIRIDALDHEPYFPRVNGVPAGFPRQLHSPLVWDAKDMGSKNDWIIHLTDNDTMALELALRAFQKSGLHVSQISKENFPLPEELATLLDDVSEQCYSGRGFCVLRGLDPRRFTEEEHGVLYGGISAHVAPERGFQDFEKEQVLCHLKNSAPYVKKETIVSPGFTDGAMAFHTDLGDILSLYIVDVSAQGGRSLIASSWKVYNDLAVEKPEVLHTLAENWTFDTFRDKDKYPPFTRPLLHCADGKVIFQCSRRPFTGFGPLKRDPSLPPITRRQIDALDSIHYYAARNAITLDIQRGDVIYMNNMSILHGRESYEKPTNGNQAAPDTSAQDRHLLKFFLRDPKRAWKMPPALEKLWHSIYGPNRPDGSREEVWVLVKEKGVPDRWQVNG